MKLIIDTEAATLTVEESGNRQTHGLYTKEAFELLSLQWLRVGWSLRQYMTFTWQGLPVLQLPEDLLRLQEAVHRIRPTLIVETGVCRGGSLLFSATLCKAADRGRVVGIDRHIPAQVRSAIESHALSPLIRLIEGDSVSTAVVAEVAGLVEEDDTVLVILDSDHAQEHVLAELERYSRFVTPGSYVVAADGIMRDLADVPGGSAEWAFDNPFAAATEFLERNPEFERAPPPWPHRESELTENVSYWPGGWLRRRP